MPKLSKEYWVLWKEKFWSLFVSGKLILYFATFIMTSILLIFKFIDGKTWSSVVITAITVIAGFRGLVQIAHIRDKNFNSKTTKEGELREAFDLVKNSKGTSGDYMD